MDNNSARDVAISDCGRSVVVSRLIEHLLITEVASATFLGSPECHRLLILQMLLQEETALNFWELASLSFLLRAWSKISSLPWVIRNRVNGGERKSLLLGDDV